MSRLLFVEADIACRVGTALLVGCAGSASLSGCTVFEEPLSHVADGGSIDSLHSRDGGTSGADDGREDAGERMHFDASADSDVEGPDRDAGRPDGASDGDAATSDAGSEPVEIPKRPDLEPCGFGTPSAYTMVKEPLLGEVSGLAVSRRNARVFWMIEDSGNGASVHAVNDEGNLVATFSIIGGAVDYEDMAIGPGPIAGTDYLYIGDIGDNNGSRTKVTVYRAPEPVVAWDQAFVSMPLEGVDPLPMVYPEGSPNAETLMVDPDTQDIYIVTKDGFTRPNTLYRLSAPHTPATTRTLEALGGVFAGVGSDISISSGAISADGSHIILRSLHSANHWDRAPGSSIPDTILNTIPCDAALARESKGESVSLSADGYFTISEGAFQPVYFAPFVPPDT